MKWISVKQAAGKLGISTSAVYARIKKDEWRHKKIGRAFLIVEEDTTVPEVPPGRVKLRDFAKMHGLRIPKLNYRIMKYKIHTEKYRPIGVHAETAYFRESDTAWILECYHKGVNREAYSNKGKKNEPTEILVRFHDCKDYEKCLNAAAYKNRHFDCRTCKKYQQQKEAFRRWEKLSSFPQSCAY